MIRSKSFGPEFSLFFVFTHHQPLVNILAQYLHFDYGWYRPTQFLLPYWIGDHFLDWHDLAGWRYAELLTVVAVCALIYILVLQLMPGRRTAAFFAALYFTCVPTIYAPLHELFAFDFLHIVFTLICVITFIAGYRASGLKSHILTFLSWISCVIALTCKEITIVIPVFLLFASAILLAYEPRRLSARRDVCREVLRLIPFGALIPLYWTAHLRSLASQFGSSGDYRLGANWTLILENMAKYPLWFARIYGVSPDHAVQALGYINTRNTLIGVELLLLVTAAWLQLWRDQARHCKYGLFACAWIAVFLIVPVYSGGYFWHGNLALCGYCMLVGAAVDWGLKVFQSRHARLICAMVLIAGTIAATRVDAARGIKSGYFATAHRVDSSVLSSPPLPLDRVTGHALIFIEDWQGIGAWNFGAGNLFHLAYRDPDLEQVTVPRRDWIDAKDLSRWLQHPNAFFFRYDDQFKWQDATDEFRSFAGENVNRKAPPPAISHLIPTETHAGIGFNVQPDGSAAISVMGQNFRPGSIVLLNGQKTETAFGGSDGLSATVPPPLFARPGDLTFQIQNSDGQISGRATFRVTR